MGLKITNEISTDRGVTNEAYINIDSQSFKKADGELLEVDAFSIDINLYLSEDDRLENPLNTCSNVDIPRYFGYLDKGSPGILSDLKGSDTSAFAFAYSLLKVSLENRGFTVVNTD